MALTSAGRSLTEAHRREQGAIRTRFTGAFLAAWPLLTIARLDASSLAWLAVVESLVDQYRGQSAEAAAEYYQQHRSAELTALDLTAPDVVPLLDDRADPAALRTSLLVTGPVTIKRLTGQGVPVEQAARVVSVRAESAAARHVLDGGRATMRRTVNADPVALGWARVTDADPCWFCAMLASRGPVYKARGAALFRSGSGGQVYHDGCGCTVEPVYSLDTPWPGTGRDWQRLWQDVAEGLPAEDARRAFRRAVDERQQSGTPSQTSGTQPQDAGSPAEPTPEHGEPARSVPAEPESSRAEAGQSATEAHERAEEANQRRAEVEPLPAKPEPEGALTGIDVEALSDDELFDLFGRLSSSDDFDVEAVDRLYDEMFRREEATAEASEPEAEQPEALAEVEPEQLSTRQEVPPPPEEPADTVAVDPLDGIDLASVSDDELLRLFTELGSDVDACTRIGAELDRRDQETQAAASAPLLDWPADEELTDEQRRIDELMARGWSYLDAYAEVYDMDPAELERQQRAEAIDVDRQAGESREAAVRRMYDDWIHLQLLAAEEATRGNLITRAAQAAGIDPVELFSGPAARARKWASEDLKRWWADGNERLTFTEFKAQMLGRDADRRQAELIALGGNSRDFGL